MLQLSKVVVTTLTVALTGHQALAVIDEAIDVVSDSANSSTQKLGSLRRNDKGSLILSFAALANEFNMGGGVLIEANLNGQIGIEFGALFLSRRYDVDRAGLKITEEVSRIHIPIVARFWATDFLSMALGPFIAFKTGTKKTSLQSGDTRLGSINTSADDSFEYGMDAAFTIDLAVANKTGVFIEGRYSDTLDEKPNEDSDQISALAGIKLDI